MKQARPDGVLSRAAYLVRAREFAARGEDLPQSRLTEDMVREIRSAAVQRDNLRQYIRDTLSNQALAEKYGVHHRTVEKVLQRDTWGQT